MRTDSQIRAVLTAVQILGLTLWAEARGEGRAGLVAVGCVIRNRADNPGWWGRSIEGVCLKPWQFSCWNLGDDPNHLKLLAQANLLLDHLTPDARLDLCLGVAGGIVDRTTPDAVDRCDHYYNPKAMKPAGTIPSWAKDPLTKQPMPPVKIVGSHWFYRLGLDGKPGGI